MMCVCRKSNFELEIISLCVCVCVCVFEREGDCFSVCMSANVCVYVWNGVFVIQCVREKSDERCKMKDERTRAMFVTTHMSEIT
jgi:hypothetical protein